jgi:hypothetical protein
MSKTKIDITNTVMSKITTGNVRMKPKWYFVLGSLGLILGLASLVIVSVFLISLISFSLRTHGPMGEIRYQQLLSIFPWWAPIIALIGIVTGVFVLKQFDFSYQKNFLMIIVIFIVSILIAGLTIDHLGIDSLWSRGGRMQKLYQQYDGEYQRRGPGNGRFQKNYGI